MGNNSRKIEWRGVPGFETKYQVSNTGLMRRFGSIYLLKGGTTTLGYRKIRLVNSPVYWNAYIHQLVLLAFVGECPQGYEVNHKDGNPGNNRLENLEYLTHRQNIQHSFDVLGRTTDHVPCGEKHVQAKLTDDKVREIRRLYVAGSTMAKLADLYEVSSIAIWSVIHRKTWKHIE